MFGQAHVRTKGRATFIFFFCSNLHTLGDAPNTVPLEINSWKYKEYDYDTHSLVFNGVTELLLLLVGVVVWCMHSVALF